MLHVAFVKIFDEIFVKFVDSEYFFDPGIHMDFTKSTGIFDKIHTYFKYL